jgi:hypothetical protein
MPYSQIKSLPKNMLEILGGFFVTIPRLETFLFRPPAISVGYDRNMIGNILYFLRHNKNKTKGLFSSSENILFQSTATECVKISR